MKTCPKCEKEFDTTSSYCPPCLNDYQKQKGYNRKCYLKNKKEILARFHLRRKARHEAMRKAKSKPCTDCGIAYPYWIMQFDHIKGEKSFNIGVMVYKIGIKRLMEEIAKCEVVCANCHADRTYRRQVSVAMSSS